jgi:hypothetical protein
VLARATAGVSPARDKLGRPIMATAIWPPGVPCPSGVRNVAVRLAAIVFTSSDPG